MSKYEKPRIVEISDLTGTEGYPDCADGSVNVDTCALGSAVTGGCMSGGVPSIVCGGGGSV